MAQTFANVRPSGGFPVKGTLPSPRLFHVGGQGAAATADFNNTTVGASTELRLGELHVVAPCWTTGCSQFNATTPGTDTTRHILYNSAGIIVCATAGTICATSDVYQRLAWTQEFISVPGTATAVTGPTFLAPGTYYLGHIQSGTTATVQTYVVGSFGASMVVAVYATAGITTSLTIVPPVDFTTLQAPVLALY